MAIFKVEGGHRLHGSITPQGAKNEALQILCATLLTPERVTVHNIPRILDVMQLIELLRRMGVEVEQLAEDTYSFCAKEIDFEYLRTEDYRRRCTRLRGSVMLIGPMLARFGVGYIPKPGGDKIGRRRLDTHFIGFQKLGAKFNFDIADEFFMVEGKELKGTYMLLDEASVTGTANIVMAAVLAKGSTTIYNAACEPYLQQLCKMLNRMGARISGIASNLLTIEGVDSLGGTEHTLLPDMIEVGSFIGMAAMNQSELTVKNVSFENLGIIPAQFARMGIRFEQQGDDIHIPRHDRKACNIVVIEDDPNLRSYLEQRLSKHYNVYTAANGSEGIAKAERICPQIVITDLMMPEADGFEVCRSLRSNIKTSHIPVIMLSALGKNTENKIKALECGANVFIDKPFDMDFLLKQVANLIRSQQELKERYSKKYIAEPSKITISSMDEELLKKAMNYIERNMDNSDYNVDSFVSDMSIGRTLLYQKINDITGMSIKEFIMDVRLKRSAQLLRESDLTISEISVLTGFANPKYFSTCFKRHFDLTPSEFKKKS